MVSVPVEWRNHYGEVLVQRREKPNLLDVSPSDLTQMTRFNRRLTQKNHEEEDTGKRSIDIYFRVGY